MIIILLSLLGIAIAAAIVCFLLPKKSLQASYPLILKCLALTEAVTAFILAFITFTNIYLNVGYGIVPYIACLVIMIFFCFLALALLIRYLLAIK